MDRPPSRDPGPIEAGRALGTSILTLLGARLELLGVELKEEAERRKRLVVLIAVAGLFLAFALLLLAFLVVVVLWDSYRIAAIVGVTLAYAGIGAVAYFRYLAAVRDSPPPFSATLSEFRKDLDMIRGRDEQP